MFAHPGGQDPLPRLEAAGDTLRAQASLLDRPIKETPTVTS